MPDLKVLNYKAPKGHGIVYGWYYLGILVYAGSTVNTVGTRAGEVGEGYVNKKYSSKFGKFLLLHGWENFEVRILATPELSELTKVEDEYITNFNLIEEGCNLYHACIDEEDTDAYTYKLNGYKHNKHTEDPLRGDVRIGTIHDRVLKLNLIDKDVFKDVYISPSHGNKEINNPLTFFDANNTHTTVQNALRQYFLKEYAKDYNISIDKDKAEDRDDYRREVILVNQVGRSYKKIQLNTFLQEHNL